MADDPHAAERRMLAEVGVYRPARTTVDDMLRQRRKERAGDGKGAGGAGGAGAGQGMVTALVERLTALESADLEQRRALREREAEAAALRLRLRDAGERASDEVYRLRLENERLQRQASEMERFLADYGLVWVGYRADTGVDEAASSSGTDGGGKAKEEDAAAGAGRAAPNEAFPFDMARVRAAVRDLNGLASEGEMQVVNERGVARLAPPPSLRMAVYRDGIFLRGGPLRPFRGPDEAASRRARAFVQDMLDGYFPSELREEFPDGVVFDLVDRSAESGPRGAAGGANLLRRLPEHAVRQGKVVQIRAAIAGGRSGAAAGPVVVDTEAMRDAGAEDVTTLQVKAHGASARAMLIKMRFDDTVGDVLEAIARHRAGSGGGEGGEPAAAAGALELVTNFPRRVYAAGHAETLRDAGLTPNATLILRPAADGTVTAAAASAAADGAPAGAVAAP